MPSEELQHRYPLNIGKKIGDFELFQTQLTTLNQFSEHGILSKKDFGKWRTQKCDAIIISRTPFLRTIAIGEDKSTGRITNRNWKKLSKDLLESKLNPTDTKIGYLTDGATTYWIAGGFDEVKLITRDDNKALPVKIDFNDKTFVSEFTYIVNNYDPDSGVVKSPTNVNPHALAKSVWQTIWRLKADRPEDCLATFVELFVYKFLNDLNLMQRDHIGTDVSIDYLLSLDKEYCFQYYMKNIRPYIKHLFPEGEDGLSIINGIVFQPTNKDHNYIFHELLKKFIKFGSLKNTDPEFKTKLYESFLQESDTTTTFGQFFTPRKIVGAIYDMAQVGRLSHGREICDPASGVGGFILEQMARDLQGQWVLSDDQMEPIHKWKALEIVPKTAILAKANALVHCGDLLADQPSRVPAFAKWLNEVFNCRSDTSLGALDDLSKDKYDLIISNPPYVVSGSADIGKLINNSPVRKEYFARKYSGVEGLFVQFIVQALKPNGDAWVLLPETFFMRTTDKVLRDWVYQNCELDLLALLPERTFFNTPKRVVVAHLKKRPVQLSPEALKKKLEKENVLLFAVSEIGESRDARRLPIAENDLEDLITAYKLHSVGAPIDPNVRRAVITQSINLYQSKSINIRHYWDKSVAQELGLLTEDEDPVTAKKSLDRKMESLESLIVKWQKEQASYPLPKTVKKFKKVKLGQEEIFELRIGKRVLKKDIYQKQTGIPLFSANVRKTFGFVEEANAGNLLYGGALWSIDSDFDSVGVAPGEVYSITDHCGQVEILVEGIEPRYLAPLGEAFH
ncbi:N-6 DNA methylase [Acinetobacter baumannii]|nr:N-6 DNA methylase [Acinetobacter baumannii]